jgi:hypothetical protein
MVFIWDAIRSVKSRIKIRNRIYLIGISKPVSPVSPPKGGGRGGRDTNLKPLIFFSFSFRREPSLLWKYLHACQ